MAHGEIAAAGDGDRQRRCLVGLSLVPGLGPVRVARLIGHFGSPETAWTAPPEALADVPGIGRVIAAAIAAARGADDVDVALRQADGRGARVVTWLDAGYPVRLRGIPASPPVLYVRGTWRDDRPSVAIVGTRRATPYGLGVAERLAAALAGQEVTIVSGLARGIDAAAHHAVVRAGGSTVGVLACGVDVAYPPEHRSLIDAMAVRGALVAEAPMGAPPERGCFPARNRLISGLADAIIVIEARLGSGALITARQAAVQGRAVFAVPGSVYARGSEGPHRLLAAGAKVVTGPDDVLAALGRPTIGAQDGDRYGPTAPDLTPPERRVIAALDDGEARSIDGLAIAAGISVAEAAATLVALELRGLVRRIAGGLYANDQTSRRPQI
ncbi:MAG TPA: DNA-processing protein DprA [bacterium]|nr:DNA-processing protein DprA [bacterium]